MASPPRNSRAQADGRLSNPAAHYATPEALLIDDALTREQKIAALRCWAYDATELGVALEEGMAMARLESCGGFCWLCRRWLATSTSSMSGLANNTGCRRIDQEGCMRKQLCFLLPDVRRANLVIERLRKAGTLDEHLMIVAREDTPIDDPPTNIDKTDFYPALERGLAVGGVLGAIAGLVVLRLTPLGLVLGGAAIPLLSLIGAGVSGFMTALAGASFPNSRLTQFEDAVKRGEILIVVDVHEDEIGRIQDLVRETHSEAEFVGVEPHAPILPP